MKQATPPSTSAVMTVPDDRATDFRAVSSGDSTSGEQLLVAAYVVLWVILFYWIFRVWRGQEALEKRLSSLDAAIDKAAKKV